VLPLHQRESGAIPHKERLATLHAICLQISRPISPKFSPLFVSSDEKFDDASVAQSLCGIAQGVLFPCSPFFLKRRFAEQAEENSAVMRRQCAC